MRPQKPPCSEKRRFIRHPVCIPLEFIPKNILHTERKKGGGASATTVNISLGGLLFLSREKIAIDTEISVSLPFKDKVFKIAGTVVRCEKQTNAKLYEIGIAFTRVSDAFKVKLVEQLHLIEEYRILRSIQLNREVTLAEASREWIRLYSKRFRKLYW